ncbi:DUF1206 domain-containing protein [Novosphingopyxis sp.]|uniref:DUF1206 domain-containing protein n=1 Tax=Novosphingopyxis sp. TaxID=2709690 RepID=UPI003B59C9A9
MSRVTQVQNIARAGYLARATVYFLIGYIALTTGEGSGATDILDRIEDMPGGTLLLALTGIGLFGYGIFRLYGAAIDIEGGGDGAKGIVKRLGHVASGLGHLFLAFVAAKSVFGGADGGSSGGGGQEQAASMILGFPGGGILLALIGLCFVGAGVEQGIKAYTAKFMKLLDADAPGFVEYLGRAGFAARAVVFLAIGWFTVKAALAEQGSDVRGVGGAIASLQQHGWLFTLVALGFLLFGIFSLCMARYRTIRNEDVIERLKRAAHKRT